jgi:error-prone DNA polymerase
MNCVDEKRALRHIRGWALAAMSTPHWGRDSPWKPLRPLYARRGFVTARDLKTVPYGRRPKVVSIVTIRQRPGTASVVVFSTIEDETGTTQLIVWPKVFEKFRHISTRCRLMAVEGKAQNEQGVIYVVAYRLIDCGADLALLSERDRDFAAALLPR